MKTHLVWSLETPDGRCPHCKGVTLLVSPFGEWKVHESDDKAVNDLASVVAEDGTIGIEGDEVTAHYCPSCERITAISLNIMESQS